MSAEWPDTTSLQVDVPVIIIGAGMAGLTCAVYLKQAGISAVVLEAGDGVGGRVRTDTLQGFQLDRGFQILLTAYPEAQRLLDYSALRLKPFRSGALIRNQTDWITLRNPQEEPLAVFQAIGAAIGSFDDKIRLVELMRRTKELPLNELFRQPATATLPFLREYGFSDQIIERFFRPFFGGVFLEDALTTSSNFFEFCFRMFAEGGAAIPADGIGAIPAQLANRLSDGQVRLNCPVKRLAGHTVYLENGETLTAGALVLAVDATQAAALLGEPAPSEQAFNHTTCTYFSASADGLSALLPEQKLLLLNTHRSSAIHNVAIISDVAPTYAPTGQALISVSTQSLEVINEQTLTAQIRQELTGWFGQRVQEWKHLKTYHIPHALPAYSVDVAGQDVYRKPLNLGQHLYQCGDHTTYPSLNATMQSGREVAELIIGSR